MTKMAEDESGVNDSANRDRIPKNQADQFHAWSLPSFDSETGQIVESQEKQAQDEQASQVSDDESIEEHEETVAPLTVQQLEEIRVQAQKEGYQAGYDEGHHQGLSAGLSEGHEQGEKEIRARLEPELQAKTRLLDDLSKKLAEIYKEQQEQLQPLILDMVVGLAAQFIQREISSSPDFLVSLIQQGVAALPSNGEDICIEIHPDQKTALAAELYLDDVHWQLQANPELGPWDCKISTKFSHIQLDFQHRWQELLRQFKAGQLVPEAVVEKPIADKDPLAADQLFSTPAPQIEQNHTAPLETDHDNEPEQPLINEGEPECP